MIRLARKEDLDQLLKLKPVNGIELLKQRLVEQDKNKAKFLVAEEQKQIMGFGFLKWYGKKTHPDYPDIEDLYVGKQFRGKGIGELLLKEAEKRAMEKGFEKIGLAVNPELNNKVKIWYEKLGYQHDGKPAYIDGVYNGVKDWCVDMEKQLRLPG